MSGNQKRKNENKICKYILEFYPPPRSCQYLEKFLPISRIILEFHYSGIYLNSKSRICKIGNCTNNDGIQSRN